VELQRVVCSSQRKETVLVVNLESSRVLRFELFRVRTSACAPQNDQSVSLSSRTAKLNLLARMLAVFDHTSTLRPIVGSRAHLHLDVICCISPHL